MIRLAILFSSVLAGLVAAHPAAARDCRPMQAPPGVGMPERPGCASRPAPARATKPPLKAGRAPGFIDLGNGAQVRIGGAVGVDVRHRR